MAINKMILDDLNNELDDAIKMAARRTSSHGPTSTAGERIGRHTPGPWQFKYAEVGFSIDPIQIIGNVDTNWHGDGLCYTNVCVILESAEERANARLISAAPELYEALKSLLADITEYQTINHLGGYNNHSQRMARAALAKAGGQ